MAITATFVNSTQLTVPGDLTGVLRIGVRLRLDQGADGILITDVAAAAYSAGPDTTTITTLSAALTANLIELQHGYTFVDDTAGESNLSRHYHRASWDGSEAAFGAFDNADGVQALALAAVSDEESANKILGYDAEGTAFERKSLIAAAGHMAIVAEPGSLTFTLPQTIGPTASPTFVELTLTSLILPALTGFLVSEGEAGCSVIAPPEDGGRVLYRNLGDTAYEWRVFSLGNLLDVSVPSPEHGDALVYSAGMGKWVPGVAGSGGSSPLDEYNPSLAHYIFGLMGGEY
jgi:hypothetical protein